MRFRQLIEMYENSSIRYDWKEIRDVLNCLNMKQIWIINSFLRNIKCKPYSIEDIKDCLKRINLPDSTIDNLINKLQNNII